MKTELSFKAADEGSASSSVADWLSHIQKAWALGAANTIELANVVSRAKANLRRGEWSALWKSGEMPFSKRKTEILVAIARNLGALNAQTSAHLPWGWSILYELSHLDRATIARLAAEGVIHPALTLRAARALVAGSRGQEPKECRKANILQRLKGLKVFVEETLNDWSATERELVLKDLTQLIERIMAK